MKTGKLFAGLLVMAAAMPSQAQLTLKSDQGVQGIYRYCEYSNNKVYMIEAGSSCPATIKEPTANGKGMGYFKSESHEGSSKQCIYRVSGQDRSIRVDTHAQCPLNHEF